MLTCPCLSAVMDSLVLGRACGDGVGQRGVKAPFYAQLRVVIQEQGRTRSQWKGNMCTGPSAMEKQIP